MYLVDMMRRATGGVGGSGPSVDPSKVSIDPVLQNRGGSVPLFIVRSCVSEPVTEVQMPVSATTLNFCWRSDTSPSEVGYENDQKHEQERGSDCDADGEQKDGSKAKMGYIKAVTNFVSDIDQNKLYNQVKAVTDRISLRPSDSKIEQSESLVQLPLFTVTRCVSEPVTEVQMPVSATTLKFYWRSDTPCPEVAYDNDHEHEQQRGGDCDADGEQQDGSKAKTGHIKAVLDNISPWSSGSKIEESESTVTLPLFTVTRCVSEPVTEVQMPVSTTTLKFYWRSDRLQSKTKTSDTSSLSSEVVYGFRSKMEHIKPVLSTISSKMEEGSKVGLEAGFDSLEAGLEGLERLPGLITGKGRTSAEGIGRFILTSSELIADKGKDLLATSSELIADKGKDLLARGKKLVPVVEAPSSEGRSKEGSSVSSALRHRGGRMHKRDGFETFYGIDTVEEPEMETDTIDSPRDGYDIFYGVDDTDDTPPKTAAFKPALPPLCASLGSVSTPQKTAVVPRLNLGLVSRAGMKEESQDSIVIAADASDWKGPQWHQWRSALTPRVDTLLSSRDSEVPNYSLDTFRRVY